MLRAPAAARSRLEREAGLPPVPRAAAQLATRAKRRVLNWALQPLLAPVTLNRTRAVDFIGDTLYGGWSFRTRKVVDNDSREALDTEVATSLPVARAVGVLEQLVAIHGAPRALRCDNGPELLCEGLRAWSERRGVALHFVQPRKPNSDAHTGRFNRTHRHEVLDAYIFASLADVRRETDAWLVTYNTERPHDSLGQVPPRTPRACAHCAGDELAQHLFAG
jgi:putative transposase